MVLMNYAVKDSSNVTIYDKVTMKPMLYSDYFNKFALELESDQVFAKAKGINKIAFEGAKKGTVTCEAEVVELKLMGMLFGSEFKEEKSNIFKREVFEIGKEMNLSETPIKGTIFAFTLEKDRKTQIKEISVTEANKKITYTETISDAKFMAVYYMTEKSKTKKLTVTSKSMGNNLVIVGDTVITNEFGEQEVVQFKICNCKIQSKVNLEMSAENVCNFTATFDLLIDEESKMVEMTLLD